MYLAIVLIAAALILLFLLVPVRLRLIFSHTGGKSTWDVYAGLGFLAVKLTRFLKKPKQKKKEPPKEDAPPKRLSFKDIENGFSKGITIVRYLKKKFTVKLFSLRVRMALGDAADTGIMTGAGYASIYGILGTIDRYFVLKKHEVSITPVFQGIGLEIEFCGIFQLRLIHCLGLIQKIRKEDVQ